MRTFELCYTSLIILMSEARANNKGKEACTVNVKEFTRGEVSDEPKAYGSMSDNTEVATDASIIDRLAAFENAANADRELVHDILSKLEGLHQVISAEAGVADAPVLNSPPTGRTDSYQSPVTTPSQTSSSGIKDNGSRKAQHSVTFATAHDGAQPVAVPTGSHPTAAQPKAIIPSSVFSAVVNSLQACLGPAQRKAVIQNQVSSYLLTASQFAMLLSMLRYTDERSWAARCLRQCVVDVENCAEAILMHTHIQSHTEQRAILQCLLQPLPTASTASSLHNVR